MALSKHDMIQIDGLHPFNPITGERIDSLLQYFAVTKEVQGPIIPHDALWPTPGGGYPAVGDISIERVVLVNLRRVTLRP